jgi:hypothetical protein
MAELRHRNVNIVVGPQGVSDMKQKIRILVEGHIIRLAKRKAAEEGRRIGDLIQDALVQYLLKYAVTSTERKMAYQLFCERPMRIPPEQLRYVLKGDMWDL